MYLKLSEFWRGVRVGGLKQLSRIIKNIKNVKKKKNSRGAELAPKVPFSTPTSRPLFEYGTACNCGDFERRLMSKWVAFNNWLKNMRQN